VTGTDHVLAPFVSLKVLAHAEGKINAITRVHPKIIQ